ncbi:MAG: hypothetical protein WCO86_01850, partial [Planctomycetota bacterium]
AGLSLAATSEDGGVYIWDFESGVLQNRIDLPGTQAIQYLDDRTLVVAVMNRLVLIAADDGTIRGEVALPTLIDAMVLTPDRQAALTMSRGGVLHRIHLPDLATRQSQLQLDDLLGFRLEISPDGRLLAVMYGSECMLVDPQSLQPLAQLPAYDKKLTCLAFDKDTRYLAVGGAQIALWDLAIIRGELIRLGLDFSELETEDAVAVLAASMRETQGRAAKAKIIATAAALPGVLEELSQKATDDGQFQAELGRHHMEQGSVALANTAYSKARILFERQLVKEPQNSEVAGELAQVLLEVQDHSIVTHLTARTLHQIQIGDPWARLATAYHCADDQAAFEQLIAQHPTAASAVGDLYLARQEWQHAIEAYNKVITDTTTDVALLSRRAEACFAAGQWALANSDLLRVCEQQPELVRTGFDRFRFAQRWNEATQFGSLLLKQRPEDSVLWVQIPPIIVLAQDDAAYHSFCQAVVQAYRQAPTGEATERVIKGCLLRPGAIDLAELPGDLLAQSLNDGTLAEGIRPWGLCSLALLEYRGGDAESAVKHITQSEQLTPLDKNHALNLAVLALAQHQLKHPDEARQALDEAAEVIQRLQAIDRNDHDLLYAEILYREANALINGKEAPQESRGKEK